MWIVAQVRHYFGEVSPKELSQVRDKFIPDAFTPAQVEQLCAEHDTVGEFVQALGTLKPKEY